MRFIARLTVHVQPQEAIYKVLALKRAPTQPQRLSWASTAPSFGPARIETAWVPSIIRSLSKTDFTP